MFTLMAVGGRGEGGVATGSQEGLLGDAIVDTEGGGDTCHAEEYSDKHRGVLGRGRNS